MVNLGERIFTERLVGECETIRCVKCRREYVPTQEDISLKNPNVYWKNCQECRAYLREAQARHLKKKLIVL